MLSMHIVSLLEMMQWRSVYCGKKRMDKTSVTSPPRREIAIPAGLPQFATSSHDAALP